MFEECIDKCFVVVKFLAVIVVCVCLLVAGLKCSGDYNNKQEIEESSVFFDSPWFYPIIFFTR